MLFVGCILCIVNVTRCAERTLRVCSWCGGFFMYRSVDVMGVVDFLCTVRLMLWVWWIFYVPFGWCSWWGGFFMYRSVDVLGVVDFLCTVRLMLWVGWIFYVSFGWCYLLGGFYVAVMLFGAHPTICDLNLTFFMLKSALLRDKQIN
jgi:uncharacterized membrane protein YedE/YeeE